MNTRKYDARRRQILESAATCFAAKGFHRTTTAEICAAAGMSTGNIFHYFPTKQAIVETIIEEERRQTAACFADLSHREDAFDALLDFMDIVLELAGDPEALALTIEIAAEAARDPRIKTLLAENDAALQGGLVALLKKASARGHIDGDLNPIIAARWIAALIDGTFNRAAIDPRFNPHEERQNLRLLVTRYLRPGNGM
ncbi:TetR/AcrR family transcriptional regulator [Agrobacterium salinitolerans]